MFGKTVSESSLSLSNIQNLTTGADDDVNYIGANTSKVVRYIEVVGRTFDECSGVFANICASVAPGTAA